MKLGSTFKQIVKEEVLKKKALNEVRLLLEKDIEVGDTLTKKLKSIKGNNLATNMLNFLNSDNIKDVNVDYVDYDRKNEKLFTLGYKDREGNKREKLLKLNKLMSYLGASLDNVKGYEIEDVINHLKAADTSNLKLVKGDDILKVYHCENYDEGETMGSCMRHDYAQTFLQMYTDNPNQVQCLALINPENGKVRGRALVWSLDNGGKFMDRIYVTNKQWHVEFNNFAEQNGIDRGAPSGNVTLENAGEYSEYPYMDTFEYYNPETGVLSDDDPSGEEGWLHLQDTHGGHSEAGEWSEVNGERIPRDQAVYVDHIEDWVWDHEIVMSYKDEVLYRDSDDVVRITAGEYEHGWALESDTVELYNNHVAVTDDAMYLDDGEYTGDYALYDDVVDTVEGSTVLRDEAVELTTGQHQDEYTLIENAWRLISGDEEGEIIHEDDLDDYLDVEKVQVEKD